jgi:hypothetical protein
VEDYDLRSINTLILFGIRKNRLISGSGVLLKRKLNLGKACCHSVQNLLSFQLLSKNIKIIIYRTIIFPVVLYGYEAQSLTLREEHRPTGC